MDPIKAVRTCEFGRLLAKISGMAVHIAKEDALFVSRLH